MDSEMDVGNLPSAFPLVLCCENNYCVEDLLCEIPVLRGTETPDVTRGEKLHGYCPRVFGSYFGIN